MKDRVLDSTVMAYTSLELSRMPHIGAAKNRADLANMGQGCPPRWRTSICVANAGDPITLILAESA